jgi:hypothetical protein
MHLHAAGFAVEDPGRKFPIQVGVHLQELEPEHLCMDGDRVIASTRSLRFIDELVGLDGLLGNGPDGVLEDLALSASHVREGSNVSPTRWKPL